MAKTPSNLTGEKKKIEEDALSWDYVLRFTDLGDNDPLIEALQNDLAGIYQIRAKFNHGSGLVFSTVAVLLR